MDDREKLQEEVRRQRRNFDTVFIFEGAQARYMELFMWRETHTEESESGEISTVVLTKYFTITELARALNLSIAGNLDARDF